MKDSNQDPRMTPVNLWLWSIAQEMLAHEAMGQSRKPNVRERQPVNLNDADAEWLKGVGIKL